MIRRYVIMAVSFVAFVGIVLGVGYLQTRPTPGVTLENAHRIRYAMTLEEVEEVFGETGADNGGGGFPGFVRYWKNGDLEIEVLFHIGIVDPNTREAGACSVLYHFEGHGVMWDGIEPPDDDRVLAKLLRWLHLR